MGLMRVLVIGGTRLSGPDIVRELLERDHLPAVLHRGEHEPKLPGCVQHFHGDAGDVELLRYARREFQPTALIHMWAMHPTDIETTVNVFGEELERFVMISSGDVYAAFEAFESRRPTYQPSPIAEDAPLRSCPYKYEGGSYDKVGAERAALQAWDGRKLPSVIVRYPGVYGFGPVREWYWVKRIRDGRHRIALPDGGLNIFHRGFAANLAHAVCLALERAEPGSVYNAGDESQFNVRQLTEMIADIAGHEWEEVSVPGESWPWGTPYSLYQGHLLYDLTRIKEELGYRDIVSPQEALRVTVEYLSCNKPGFVSQIFPKGFDYAAEDAVMDRFRV